MKKVFIIGPIVVCACLLSLACTKVGEVIYKPDPEDQADTSPLVSVVYDPNALGDMGYNDLIYKGVEDAARQHGLRTLQLSPTTVEEGVAALETAFQTMSDVQDTVRRLLIVAGVSYDTFVRKNNDRIAANSRADLLYLETHIPLEGKGSTLDIPYYGAMYEAGAIAPVDAAEVLLVGANPKAGSVAAAVQGFADGFQSSPIQPADASHKKLVTTWLSDDVSGGFSVADSTALRVMHTPEWQSYPHLLVPVCGGAGVTFRRLSDMLSIYHYVGVDYAVVSAQSNFSVVKHIDRAVSRCIEQWLSPEGMPKHQSLGLADGFTGVEIHPYTEDSKERFAASLGEELRQQIHRTAIEKEADYEK